MTHDDIRAHEFAEKVLLEPTRELSAVGRQWREHAAAHLAARLDAELRGGTRRIEGEAEAAAFLKGAARDLRAAAEALHVAAEKFRSLGHGYPANRTFHAATAAERAAERLDPS